ncbi:MAG: Abi family protein [Candidatus Ornithomonoglobus sp.]
MCTTEEGIEKLKPLKTVDELIEHLKNKGCRFTIVDEDSAKKFLSEHNYYMKLAAYRANYDKVNKGKREGEYKNLEFAYLQELSTIDMRLRYIIMHMCADIEHNIRVKLLHDIEVNPYEDGYTAVNKFVGGHITNLRMIKNHQSSEYTKNLINKYYPNFPAWVYMELITFGTLAHFCDFYSREYKRNFLDIDINMLNSVRDLRNASVHHNCIINQLKKGDNQPLLKITQFVGGINGIGEKSRRRKLSNKFLYDFTTLLYVYNNLVMGTEMKRRRIGELSALVNNRMNKHSDYFVTNEVIKSSFEFMRKVVNYMGANLITK